VSGRGPAPKPAAVRRTRHVPKLGEMKTNPLHGWQHGPVPEPPDGLVAASREAWATWMASWFAANWTPADLPGLGLVIAQYDAVQRGGTRANDMTALVRLMDTYGITPAGQQARRWAPPSGEEQPADNRKSAPVQLADSPYAHLKVAK
jgi:hypothetical protein